MNQKMSKPSNITANVFAWNSTERGGGKEGGMDGGAKGGWKGGSCLLMKVKFAYIESICKEKQVVFSQSACPWHVRSERTTGGRAVARQSATRVTSVMHINWRNQLQNHCANGHWMSYSTTFHCGILQRLPPLWRSTKRSSFLTWCHLIHMGVS